MERVVKRFLMHNQTDADDPTRQNEYDGFRQDLSTIRYEMVNDMKKSKEENAKNMKLINTGLEFVADELTKCNTQFSNRSPKAQYFRYKELLNENLNEGKSSSQFFFGGADNLTPKKF